MEQRLSSDSGTAAFLALQNVSELPGSFPPGVAYKLLQGKTLAQQFRLSSEQRGC